MKINCFLFLSFFFLFFSKSISQTNVSGHISSNTIWTKANSPYEITDDLIVDAGVTLTIQPGTKVYFNYDQYLDYHLTKSVKLEIMGTLYAVGNVTDSIMFLKDSTAPFNMCGQILIDSTSQNSFIRFARIDNVGGLVGYVFGGYNQTYETITCYSSSCDISYNTFSNIDASYYISPFSGLTYMVDFINSTPFFNYNNFINDQGYNVVACYGGLRNIKSNIPLQIGVQKGYPALYGDTMFSGHTYTLISDTLQVEKNTTLSILPGAVLNTITGDGGYPYAKVYGIINVAGSLIAEGSPSNFIHLVSGISCFSGGAGYASGWLNVGYIQIFIQNSKQPSSLKYVSGVFYMNIYNTNSSISQCIFQSNPAVFSQYGSILLNCTLTVDNSVSPVIANSCFYGSSILCKSGKPLFNNCNFNKYFFNDSIYNTNAPTAGQYDSSNCTFTNSSNSDTVNAINCYWGNATGPEETTSNPNGKGAIVSKGVVYIPYNTTSSSCSEQNLPVTIIDFNAFHKGNSIEINWITANELNLGHFIVQHSTNGIEFENIASFSAHGVTSNIYQFIDASPKTGLNYYRLESIDKNGAASFSEIKSVDMPMSDKITLSPNPAKDIVNIHFTKSAGSHLISVFNLAGKLLIQQNTNGGNDKTTLNVSTLSGGMYIVNIRTGSINLNQKLFINR